MKNLFMAIGAISISFSFANAAQFSNPLDEKLARYIERFKYKAIKAPSGVNKSKFALGKKLFFDKNLSGNRDISCATCHDPEKGSADALPLPLGVGIGAGKKAIVARNSPPLFNLDHPELETMFWDGRLSYDSISETYNTPSKVLNGDYPERMDITEVLGGALGAQAIFPIISHDEMRGLKGSNEVADAPNDEAAWKILMDRILKIDGYKELFEKAFPEAQKFNIGHLGNALSEFQRVEFASYNTPWDRYINGELDALSESEKRGAVVFNTVGRCNTCHGGALLGGQVFANVAAPQVGPGKDIRHNDEGRFYVTGQDHHRYRFRTPPLRNVALTAPYFHTGAYESLSDVIDHYTKGVDAIDDYSSRWLETLESSIYGETLFVETNPYRIFRKKENAHNLIKHRMIHIGPQEKRDLLKFLKLSLTDPKFK